MKQALVTIDYRSLPFVQRLDFVQAAVNDHVSGLGCHEQAAIRARLWCVWLCREVLS